MSMTNKNVSLAIMFGLLLTFAGSSAFAGPAYDQLLEAAKAGSVSGDPVDVRGTPGNTLRGTNGSKAAALAGDTKAAPAPVVGSTIPAPAAAAAPEPAPNPIKKVVGDHKAELFMGGLGAYLGFALMGPAGILIGALFVVGFILMANA